MNWMRLLVIRANIAVPAGRYNVIFNDIDGFYYFYSLD